MTHHREDLYGFDPEPPVVTLRKRDVVAAVLALIVIWAILVYVIAAGPVG